MKSSLKTFSRVDGIIYGPVSSRRFGVSLGVNVFPGRKKACSFDCPYCQLGLASMNLAQVMEQAGLPAPGDVERELKAALERIRGEGRKLDCLTFSGNGEPTAHPKFPQIVEGVHRVRDALVPNAHIVVLTNGAHLDRSDVVTSLNRCCETVVKLDAGTEETFRQVNRPGPNLRLEDLLRGIKTLKRVTIQTMFVTGSVDNSTDTEVNAWLVRLKEIRPNAVQIYTLDRHPADETVQQVSRERLGEIAGRVRAECGIEPLLV